VRRARARGRDARRDPTSSRAPGHRERDRRDLRPVEPPPSHARSARSLLKGGKYGAGGADKRTEAGVEWALDSRVSLQLNYERTSQSPMMPFDHDNGILTRVRIGF
jgi:hypothetical protein